MWKGTQKFDFFRILHKERICWNTGAPKRSQIWDLVPNGTKVPKWSQKVPILLPIPKYLILYLLMLLKINEVGFEPANISLITLKSNNIPAFLIKEGSQATSTWGSMGITRFNTCSISDFEGTAYSNRLSASVKHGTTNFRRISCAEQAAVGVRLNCFQQLLHKH